MKPRDIVAIVVDEQKKEEKWRRRFERFHSKPKMPYLGEFK